MPEQIPLFQQLQPISFDGYWPGDNAEVIDLIKTQILAPDQMCLYLWGKAGVGKSHLLQAACSFAHQRNKRAVYLPFAQENDLQPDMLQGLEDCALICMDDLDAVAGQGAWESALFHLYNRAREADALMLFSATHKPADLGIALPDLRSRLSWGSVWHIQELPDRDKLAALQMRAQQRGFLLPDDVGSYMMQRSARDMHSLFALLDTLDHASLSEHRKLTIPFVRQFL